MRHLRIFNTTRHSVLGTRIGVAETWWSRLRGFLGRPEPRPGEGLMLVPCRGVHMHGMKYALDVIFIDQSGAVLRTYPGLQPGRRTPYHRDAEYVIEVPVGTIAATGTAPGDRVVWLPATNSGGTV
jgi:uncharacterized membrane protein (UPF0127 family)